VVAFRLEFISTLLRAFLLHMSGAGHSCDWLLVALLEKKTQASDTPTSQRNVRQSHPIQSEWAEALQDFFNAAVWTGRQ